MNSRLAELCHSATSGERSSIKGLTKMNTTLRSQLTTTLTPTHFQQAVTTLSRAFFTDPMMTFIAPSDALRERASPWFFAGCIKIGQMNGVVHTTGTGDGVAVWLHPDHPGVGGAAMLKSGLLTASFRLGWSGFSRFLTMMEYAEKAHKQTIQSPHWYLLSLGVEPACQGRGIGSQLLQPMLEQVDKEGLPCYLETDSPRNVPFYQRHGFEVKFNGTVPKGGPEFWAMVRRPRR